jgi:hypothetical protein
MSIFPDGEIAQHLLIRALGAHGIAIQARDPGGGKFLAQFFLELFRARADKIDVLGIALRAAFRHTARKSAVVAFEALALLVIRQRNAAILALHARAARPAKHEPGIPAPIDEDQRLRFSSEARGDGFAELRGDRPRAMRGLEILAQIDDFHRRKRPVLHARIELQEMIFSRARILKAFERGRRRTEQRDRPFELRAHDGHVPAVIARRFFLLVAGLLLLVDDDQPQIFDRRENGRARSHHDARLAAAHAPPLARALHFRQRAVQHRDARAESRPAQAGPSTASARFPAPE